MKRSIRGLLTLLALLALSSCGDDGLEGGNTPQAIAECGTPTLAESSAQPFDWIGVADIPDGFRPAAAEVTAGADTLLAPLSMAPDGSNSLRVPVHPSFRLEGGDVQVRIYADENHSCEPVMLTIAALPSSPGAMAAVTRELRAALDEIVEPLGAGPLAAELAETDARLPLFAVPALWALPALEELERLLAEDTVGAASAVDRVMLDAIAGRLRLTTRMQEFRQVVSATGELAGDLVVAASPQRLSRTPWSGIAHASMASPLTPVLALGQQLLGGAVSAPSVAPVSQSSCPADQFNLFDIAEPEKLDNLMRVQDYAQRFLAGTNDQSGGSASGTVFGDLGVVMGWMKMLGKQGKVAAKVWEAFSEVVMNTAEAYAGLLPGDMELELMAAPTAFEEDSEKTGRWTARAVAHSDGMKLTRKIIEKVMQKALEKGLADASIGKPLRNEVRESLSDETLDRMSGREAIFWNKFGDRAADKLDKTVIEEPTRQALKDLLDAIGAEEGPDGFDIPAGCWMLPDMSKSDDPKDDKPPLITAHLIGEAVAFVDDGSEVPRTYKPATAGETSRLEVRTAADYMKTFEWRPAERSALSPIRVGTTHAYGGEQRVAATQLSVLEIEVDVYPSIIKIDPGERVPFAAVVRNAVDTRVDWTASANTFREIVDNGDGSHEAVLYSPTDPALYPIRIEVESTSRSGLRASGQPRRIGVAYVQIENPLLEIQQAGGCLSVGGDRRFVANVLGAKNQDVTWSARGPSGNAIDRNGVFKPSASGTYTIRATWTEDPSVEAEVDVEVADQCCWFTARVSASPYAGSYAGPALLMGNGMFLRDAKTDWFGLVTLPEAGESEGPGWRGVSVQPGQYRTAVNVLAAKKALEGAKWGNKNPPDTAVWMAGPDEGAPDSRATIHITHAEGEPGSLFARDGAVEGSVTGHLGWHARGEPDPYDYLDVEIRFRAIPAAPTEWRSDSPYAQCLNSWGLETPYERAKRIMGEMP